MFPRRCPNNESPIGIDKHLAQHLQTCPVQLVSKKESKNSLPIIASSLYLLQNVNKIIDAIIYKLLKYLEKDKTLSLTGNMVSVKTFYRRFFNFCHAFLDQFPGNSWQVLCNPPRICSCTNSLSC